MKEIELTQGRVTLVDDKDYEWLSQHKWHFDRYAYRTVKAGKHKRSVRMHREILDAPKGMEVDHINGDKLDNRRSNLRVVTRSVNSRNQCRRKSYDAPAGVYWDRFRNKWKVVTSLEGKQWNIGRYTAREEAIQAYSDFAKEKGIELSRR